jgi:SAM-dependent methyltransferase
LTREESDIIYSDLPVKTAIFELQSSIEAIEKNDLLYEEKNFSRRIDVIDFIGFQVIDQIEELMRKTAQPDKLDLLKNRAEKIKSELEEIDISLFQRLQANIRTGGYTGAAFKNMINEWFDFNSDYKQHLEEPGYDNLDIFINGLFPFQTLPKQTKDLEPEMVYYQKTPARIVFELVEKSKFKKEDVFFDLGSGLGQPAILVNLLAGIKAKGIELEPAFCEYAGNCARELNLFDVEFINVDARKADYSEGTIFFMFTPFKGKILQEVLEILRKESLLRKIKIITYGPCTPEVAMQNWLYPLTPKDDNIYKLDIFSGY